MCVYPQTRRALCFYRRRGRRNTIPLSQNRAGLLLIVYYGVVFICAAFCSYLFEWSTPAACPVVEGQETAHGSCRIDSGGANIDLTSLQRQSESSDVQGTILQPSSSDMKYAIGSVAMGVCRAVTCGSDTGAGMCLDTPSGKVSLGRFNQNLEKLTDGAKLTYKDGATCTCDAAARRLCRREDGGCATPLPGCVCLITNKSSRSG